MTTTPGIGSPPVSLRVPLTPPPRAPCRSGVWARLCGGPPATYRLPWPAHSPCLGEGLVEGWARGGRWGGLGGRGDSGGGGDGHFPVSFWASGGKAKILMFCLSTLLFFSCPHRLFSTEQSLGSLHRDSWFNPRKVFFFPPGLMCLNIQREMTRRRGRKSESESPSGRGQSGNRKRKCKVDTYDTKRGTEKKKVLLSRR